MGLATSAALGLAFGGVYLVLGVLMTHVARRVEPRRGMALALAGLVARLALALAGVTLVLALTNVDAGGFVLAFLSVFAAGLAVDLVRTVRSGSRRAPSRSSSPS